MQVLVTGGFGFVGSKAVSALASRGYKVRVFDLPNHPLRRRFEEHWHTLGEVEIVEGDIARYRDVQGAVAGCRWVLHTAALLNSIAPYSQFHRVNALGTENICKVSLDADIKRLVIVSTSDVFGIPRLGEVLNEDSELTPWHEPYADTKIEAVKAARRYRDKGLPVTLIYPGWVYGPGDRQFFPAVINMINDKHVFTWERRNPYEINLTYIDDLVDALIRCLTTHVNRNGEYLILDTDTFMTPARLFRAMADHLELPVKVHHIPYPLMMLIAFCSQWLARLGIIAKPLLSTTDVKAFGNEFHFSNAHALAELQWKPTTTIEDGLRKSMEWQKKRRENPDLIG